MAIGLVGKKCGMTRVFTETGASIPVTVVEVDANRITQVKNTDVDGYQAIQVTTGTRRDSRVTAAQKGHFAKAGVKAGRGVWEFRVNDSDLEGREVGGEILADLFEQGQMVDVTGQSKGKGFQGVMHRHNFAGCNTMTHGTHEFFRHGGSIGCRKWPGRVFKGRKMPGHHGDRNVTTQNIEIVAIRAEENVLLVNGSVPGAKNSYVSVRPAIKKNPIA